MLFFRRRKSTPPYATRAADVYRFSPPAASETPLFDQAVYATGVLPDAIDVSGDFIPADFVHVLYDLESLATPLYVPGGYDAYIAELDAALAAITPATGDEAI